MLTSGWHPDPVLVAVLVLLSTLYVRGVAAAGVRTRAVHGWAFAGAMAALAVALLSPVDLLASQLAAAHMVQHVLLILVAAPLLATGSQGATILGGLPGALRRPAARLTGVKAARRLRFLVSPPVALLLHTGTLWFWHSATAYEAALASPVWHRLEHLSLLGTSMLFWWAVVRTVSGTVPSGAGVLLVFGGAMQSVLLSALLTFARTPWYPSYTATAPAWGISALADQQLAGAIMWIPAGMIYTAIALAVFSRWLRTQTAPPEGAAQLTPRESGLP